MKLIQPMTVTSDLITYCSLSEDPTPAWVSGTSYVVGNEVHLLSTHRVYRCAVNVSGTTSPDQDPINWKDIRPTNKFAPFDIYVNTQAISTTDDIEYRITARFQRSIALYGLEGSDYEITVKDTTGGTVIYTNTGKLTSHDIGWWGYLFGDKYYIKQLILDDLPIRPAAEITIKIKNTVLTDRRAIGIIVIGNSRSLFGTQGGTQYGSSAEPITFSYIKTNEDGTTTIVRRHKATNLRISVMLPQSYADIAVQILQDVLDIPVAVIATDAQGYSGLTTFGLIESSPVSYDSPGYASIDVMVKGLI